METTYPLHNDRSSQRPAYRRVGLGIWRLMLGLCMFALLAACTLRPGASDAAEPYGTEPEATLDLADEPTDVGAHAGQVDGNIADFLGYDPTDPEASKAHFDAQTRQYGEVVTSCMRAEGFEYLHPNPNAVTVGGYGYGEAEYPYLSDDYVATYGFGISTLKFSQLQVGPDLVGHSSEVVNDSAASDLNSDYLDALSETERDAWFDALYGAGDGSGGCSELAHQQVFADTAAFYDSLSDELENLYDRYEADARVIAHHRSVSDCVAEAGYSWPAGQYAWEYFEPKLESLGRNLVAAPSADDLADLPAEERREIEIATGLSIDEAAEMWVAAGQLSEQDRGELAEIQAEELELARVVTGCGGGDRNDWEATSDVFREYELRFVSENAEALDALR